MLDLSETKITYLPTQGLSGLESLRLEKVWTLSVIPSIYHFEANLIFVHTNAITYVLEEAWLTWPYHCCAFEYPETHDPAAFQKYQYVMNWA
ncbi:Follicle-stimulating hormone receptor [Orchesella cincta]|uniref:Follicle-stimulating hormone receptor n=1 Tax=Orchesella cincta TaxID=48709 RepID=A0A1D2NAR0_ORCCI|nr:Follicle-stimulating hormone receptor [Orchesella cincta]